MSDSVAEDSRKILEHFLVFTGSLLDEVRSTVRVNDDQNLLQLGQRSMGLYLDYLDLITYINKDNLYNGSQRGFQLLQLQLERA